MYEPYPESLNWGFAHPLDLGKPNCQRIDITGDGERGGSLVLGRVTVGCWGFLCTILPTTVASVSSSENRDVVRNTSPSLPTTTAGWHSESISGISVSGIPYPCMSVLSGDSCEPYLSHLVDGTMMNQHSFRVRALRTKIFSDYVDQHQLALLRGTQKTYLAMTSKMSSSSWVGGSDRNRRD